MNSDSTKHSITGYILVGGQSQRFGGDKALAIFRGKPLVYWAVDALQELGLAPVLVGPDPAPYRQWCQAAVTSENPGLGPVEGVRVSLEACPTAWALILSVDMPGVTTAVLQPLLAAHQSEDKSSQVICFEYEGSRRHPFPALYNTSVLSLVSTLGSGGPMQRLLDAVRLHTLGPGSLPDGLSWQQALHNVNAPSDLTGGEYLEEKP